MAQAEQSGERISQQAGEQVSPPAGVVSDPGKAPSPQVQLQLPVEFEVNAVMPALSADAPLDAWQTYFAAHRPSPILVRNWMLKLHREKQHKQVIAALQAALLHGQAQPWMYEVLALSMEIESYPKEEVERVAQSLVDFGGADFSSMMFAGAYLTRFERKAAALKLYQQASRMFPEQPEPYILGLDLAQAAGTTAEIQWAATGMLTWSWGPEREKYHRKAENALLEEERKLRRAGDSAGAAAVAEALRLAQQRDLTIRVEWTGAADLDLAVEEPSGGVCNVVTPLTPGGGQHLHDGVGPDAPNSFELYACPQGQPGPYRVSIRNKGGAVVSNRARVIVVTEEHTPHQKRTVTDVQLNEGVASLIVDLPRGRRTRLRELSMLSLPPRMELASGVRNPRGRGNSRAEAEAAGDYQQRLDREQLVEGGAGRRAGGFLFYAPVVQVIPEGATMSATAIVSPDRRYVRISAQPNFTNITDVFTFSFLTTGQ